MRNNIDPEDEDHSELLRVGLWTAFGTWLTFGFIIGAFCLVLGPDKVGQYADSFGMINALFSSLAVAGAIYAVVLQQQELGLTRKEMRQTREAHEDSADAQERMVTIQGYSTILADLNNDIQAARGRIAPLRLLVLDCLAFEREQQAAFGSRNFPANLQAEGKTFFSRAEVLGVWKQLLYPSHTAHMEIPRDMMTMAKNATDALLAEEQHLTAMLSTKEDVARYLTRAMGLPEPPVSKSSS